MQVLAGAIMKRAIISVAVLILLVTAAEADPFADMYDNTATSTSPSGKTTLYYFNRDGTFENHFASGRTVKGTWVWKDSHTACFTVTDPPPKPGESATNCKAFPVTHHVGDSWTETDSEGVSYTNSIRPGR